MLSTAFLRSVLLKHITESMFDYVVILICKNMKLLQSSHVWRWLTFKPKIAFLRQNLPVLKSYQLWRHQLCYDPCLGAVITDAKIRVCMSSSFEIITLKKVIKHKIARCVANNSNKKF